MGAEALIAPNRSLRPWQGSLVFAAWMGAFLGACYGTSAGADLNEAANRWTSAANVWLLNAIGVDAFLDGTYIHTTTFSVHIVDACNGLIGIVLLWAACLSAPFSWAQRLRGCLGATVLVIVLNQVRLLTELVYGSLYPQTFDILEEGVMRVFYAGLSLTTFWLWTVHMTAKQQREPSR